jgi:uncharacterized protein (DUF1697 family)
MRYAALLRGINVGGRQKVPMSDLRELLAGLGLAEVSTYLQSGNAVFSCDQRPHDELAEVIKAGVAARTGISCAVLIRTGAELAGVLDRTPLAAPHTPSRYFVAYLSGEPDQARAEAVLTQSFEPDQIWISGREAYLWCPSMPDSKLTNAFIERQLGVTATARNWNTAQKLAELTAS